MFAKSRGMVTITPATCRAARGLLDMTQRQLADAAAVGLSTIKGFESGLKAPMTNNLRAMLAALEAAGAEFTNGDNPGVRMKETSK